jgi:tetrahydromethanopterin S-methyltransferase subunit B
MSDTILLIAALIYIAGDFVWSNAVRKRIQNLEQHATNLQSILDRSDKLQTLSIEELNKFVIQNTKDLEASMISQIRRIETTTSLDLQQLTSDLDRTIASIDSIQEKIAELEVSTQNIQNNVNRLMS